MSVTGLDNSNFVLIYDNRVPGYDKDVYGQIVSGDRVKIGSEFLVSNTFGYGDQRNSSLVGLADGGFAVSWFSTSGSFSISYIQIFSASGSKVGDAYADPAGSLSLFSGSYTGNFLSKSGSNIKVFALSNDQEVYGSTLADNIVGSSGSDLILSGGGNDTITGGGGADTFVMSVATDSEVTITYFENNNSGEKIDITAFAGINSFEDLTITAGSAIVHLGDGQTIHITNLHPEDLSADNFIFAPNAVPVAVADAGSVSENGTIDIDVIANDSDADTDALSVVSIDTSATQAWRQ